MIRLYASWCLPQCYWMSFSRLFHLINRATLSTPDIHGYADDATSPAAGVRLMMLPCSQSRSIVFVSFHINHKLQQIRFLWLPVDSNLVQADIFGGSPHSFNEGRSHLSPHSRWELPIACMLRARVPAPSVSLHLLLYLLGLAKGFVNSRARHYLEREFNWRPAQHFPISFYNAYAIFYSTDVKYDLARSAYRLQLQWWRSIIWQFIKFFIIGCGSLSKLRNSSLMSF